MDDVEFEETNEEDEIEIRRSRTANVNSNYKEEAYINKKNDVYTSDKVEARVDDKVKVQEKAENQKIQEKEKNQENIKTQESIKTQEEKSIVSTQLESLEAETNSPVKEEIKVSEILPDYLKFVHEPVSSEIFSKEYEDSSSSEEAPMEVDVTETAEFQTPITNLKMSVPNSSSQELQITLKEREAGLPTSRNATCCAACQIY